jgi:hypothetical protein
LRWMMGGWPTFGIEVLASHPSKTAKEPALSAVEGWGSLSCGRFRKLVKGGPAPRKRTGSRMRIRTGGLSFSRVSVAILLANVLGVAIYLLGARYAWVIPEEAANGIHTITGEPFVWALFVLPVWTIFLVMNLTWGSIIVAQRRWIDARVWLIASFIWIVAVIVDFAHH